VNVLVALAVGPVELGVYLLEDHLREEMVEGLFLLGSDYLGAVVAVVVAVGAADSRLARNLGHQLGRYRLLLSSLQPLQRVPSPSPY